MAEKIHKDEGLVDWSLSSKEIIDKFRGLKKWPRSFFKLGVNWLLFMICGVPRTILKMLVK